MKQILFFLWAVISISACNPEPMKYVPDDDEWDLSVNFKGRTSEYIAVFGDIQYYTNTHYIGLFEKSLDWINRAQRNMDILSILHTGDIVEVNSHIEEWKCFGDAIADAHLSIPFISMIGNHDYHWDNSLIKDRYNTHFNEYVQFPLVTEKIEAAYEPGRMENVIIRNEIHGSRYDFLLLEFGPRKEVVAWAKEWVSSHPDIRYILMTHEYLEKGGGRRKSSASYAAAQFRNTTYTTPDELWDTLVRCNDNILCVLCGHVGGLYAVTYEENDFGRPVCQIQHNIQGSSYRYDNWLRMWEFPQDRDEAEVYIINTASNTFYDSSESLFTFRYRY